MQVTRAQVISQDPKTGGLNVVFPSGQVSAYPVKFGYHGPADGVRINHPAMPGRGTWGVVVFPGGDLRAGVWIASIYTQMIDARTTDTDAFTEYNSHQSGFYEIMDGQGNHSQVYPDGTQITIGSSPTPPTTYRHTVDARQYPVLQAFPDAERVPNPPAPFIIHIKTASGVDMEIDGSGNTSINVKNGQALLRMTAAGEIDITAAVKVVVTAPEVDVNASTKASITAPQVNVTATTQANITAPTIHMGGSAEALYRIMDERMIAVFNGHVHTNGNQGSNTGTPTTTLSVGAQTTTTSTVG